MPTKPSAKIIPPTKLGPSNFLSFLCGGGGVVVVTFGLGVVVVVEAVVGAGVVGLRVVVGVVGLGVVVVVVVVVVVEVVVVVIGLGLGVGVDGVGVTVVVVAGMGGSTDTESFDECTEGLMVTVVALMTGGCSLLLSAAKQALKLRIKHNNTIKAFMFKFDEIIHSLCRLLKQAIIYLFINLRLILKL